MLSKWYLISDQNQLEENCVQHFNECVCSHGRNAQIGHGLNQYPPVTGYGLQEIFRLNQLPMSKKYIEYKQAKIEIILIFISNLIP